MGMREFAKQEGRFWLMISLGVLIYMILHIPSFDEYRWYRDLTRKTPFYDVQLNTPVFTGKSVTVTGTMVKRRCHKSHAFFYTRHNGTWRLADFSTTEPKDTPLDRPPANDAQFFGPWTITARHGSPEAARMITIHSCPEGTQTNTFMEIWWPK